jgi:hypothetical protein
MAQTRRRRRRKHRGTQTGRIDRSGGRRRPRTREEAKAQARRRQVEKRDLPPSWGTAFNRGLIGAAIFFALIYFAFDQPLGGALGLGILMLAIYVPLGYYVEHFFWRRRQKQRGRAR